MKQVTFLYDVGDEVIVKPIEAKGFVVSLWYGDLGMRYEVRYWSNGDSKREYLFPKELEPSGSCGSLNLVDVAGNSKGISGTGTAP